MSPAAHAASRQTQKSSESRLCSSPRKQMGITVGSNYVCFGFFLFSTWSRSSSKINFPIELSSFDVSPNSLLVEIWRKGVRAKYENNDPCSILSWPPRLRRGRYEAGEMINKIPFSTSRWEKDKAQTVDVFVLYWWKFCYTQ